MNPSTATATDGLDTPDNGSYGRAASGSPLVRIEQLLAILREDRALQGGK